jgi:hypothetical protein
VRGGVTVAKREGEAFIEVHADTTPFPREAERGIKRGSEQVEDDLKETGDKWGETLSRSMGKKLEKSGPDLAKSVERGLNRQRVSVPITPDYKRDRAGARRVAAKIANDIEDAVLEAASGGSGGSGGGFGKIGQAFADAIGAGFNVSGKSPLIAFLIPIIGAIVGLVIAAIQTVNSLVAVLTTVPGLIAAIGFQAGVVMVAFQGVGTAVQGAFAAKNAKELKEAIKGLAPAAQDFVKSLLPLKDFFYQIRFTTQQNFFKAFGDDLIPQLLKFQGARIIHGFQELAKEMGTFFHDVGFFFNSDSFAKFLDEVFPRTITFLQQFGPAFVTFLEGLINLANASMPFMTEFGGIISMVFKQLGDFLTDTANDPEFQVWLEEMKDTLDEVVTLIKVAFVFVGQLMGSLNKAGGEEMITAIATAFAVIGDFLASDVGISSMKLFINLAIYSINIIAGLIIAIIAITGMLQRLAEWIVDDALPAIGEFFGFLWSKVTAFGNSVKAVFLDFVHSVESAASGGRAAIVNFANNVKDKVSQAISNVIGFVKSIPDRVKEFFSQTLSWLYQAGKNLIQGLINGIMAMVNPLGSAMSFVGQKVKDNVPHSPAKEGPLSGKGDTLYAGQEIVKRLALGMEMAAPQLSSASSNVMSNVTFGANSIQMRFSGMPSQEQAVSAGSAVAQGMFSTMARDTRLAVRTL